MSEGQRDDSGTDKVRVVIADDHDLYLRGLKVVIDLEDDIEIVGAAGDGLEAIRLAEELVPDLVLLDVRMPRLDGLQACRRIRDSVPSAKILMLTMSDEEEDLFEALRGGANGYLLKDVPAEGVADAIRAVHRGKSMIPPSMAALLINEFGRLTRRPGAGLSPSAPKLTERELEVLKHVARGSGNREIAKVLFISENTVKNHVRNILEKLQMHSRVEAAMYAMRSNLLGDDD